MTHAEITPAYLRVRVGEPEERDERDRADAERGRLDARALRGGVAVVVDAARQRVGVAAQLREVGDPWPAEMKGGGRSETKYGDVREVGTTGRAGGRRVVCVVALQRDGATTAESPPPKRRTRAGDTRERRHAPATTRASDDARGRRAAPAHRAPMLAQATSCASPCTVVCVS